MNEIFEQIWARKSIFLVVFFLVFTLTYIIFVALDWLPEEPKTQAVESGVKIEKFDTLPEMETNVLKEKENKDIEVEFATTEANQPTTAIVAAGNTGSTERIVTNEKFVLPTRIVIDKLGKSVAVLNPTSRIIADLDTALLSGVVRHPDSAALGQKGSVFILGHSSYLPKVFNKNFQAFNGIQDLEWGDTISLYANDKEYRYRVDKVYRAKAQEVTVPIAGDENRLTLATCNSFGSKDDRFIVEAKEIIRFNQ